MEKLHYSIIKYLKQLAETRNDTSISTAVEYLKTGFDLQFNEDNNEKYGSFDLSEIFLTAIGEKWLPELEQKFESYKQLLVDRGYFKDVKEGSKEYEDRLHKARDRFYEKYSQDENTKKTNQTNENQINENQVNENQTETTTVSPPKLFKIDVSEKDKQDAEALKIKGNELYKAQDFENAIKCYSDAIDIYSSAIYYCNRGTSYSKLLKFNEALEDFKNCLELDSTYIRAYDRLGCTYMKLGNLKEAITTFKVGLEHEPSNNDLINHLTEAQQQSEEDMGGMGGPGAPGMPNMEQMQEMFNNPQFMENMGPMQQMMQDNPQIMNMAMNMMNNPNFQQAMQDFMTNPSIANMFTGMMQGGNNSQ